MACFWATSALNLRSVRRTVWHTTSHDVTTRTLHSLTQDPHISGDEFVCRQHDNSGTAERTSDRSRRTQSETDGSTLLKASKVHVHVMETLSGRRGIAPLILTLGAGWKCVVNFISRPLYESRYPLVGPRGRLDVLEKRKISDPCWKPNPGPTSPWPDHYTEPRTNQPVACSLYRTPDQPARSLIIIPNPGPTSP